MQAVSNASSQLLQPLLALASAPHKVALPWRSPELGHVAPHWEQSIMTVTQQTPASMESPAQALVEEMLESPVTVTKPQPEGRSRFRRQSNLGMQDLINSSPARPVYDNTPRLQMSIQDEGNAACSQSDQLSNAAAVVVVVESMDTDILVDVETMPGGGSPCIMPSQTATATSADKASVTNAPAIAHVLTHRPHQEEGKDVHLTDSCSHDQTATQLTMDSEQPSASGSMAAVCQQQSQLEQQCSVRPELRPDATNAHQPQSNADAATLHGEGSRHLHAAGTR